MATTTAVPEVVAEEEAVVVQTIAGTVAVTIGEVGTGAVTATTSTGEDRGRDGVRESGGQ